MGHRRQKYSGAHCLYRVWRYLLFWRFQGGTPTKVHGQKRRCNPNPETPVRVAAGFLEVSELVGMGNCLIQYWISLWNFSILRYLLCVGKHTIKQHNTLVLYELGLNYFLNSIYFCLYYAYMLAMPVVFIRQGQIPWVWGYRQLWAFMWVLGVKP